jgi:hypothetical protein
MTSGDRTRPTHLMEQVSKTLEGAAMPLSKSAVIKEVKGKTEWVMIAIQNLIDEKFIAIENGSRNSLNLKLLMPYRESDDASAGLKPIEIAKADNA